MRKRLKLKRMVLWLLLFGIPGVWASLAGSLNAQTASPSNALVVITRDPLATDAFNPRSERLRSLFERGLTATTGKASANEAWSTLLTLQDTVGIKVHSAPGIAGTRPQLVSAIVESLASFGLSPSNIIVWDKIGSDLENAGFMALESRHGILVLSAQGAGWDEASAYTNSAVGHMTWSDHEFDKSGEQHGKRSFHSKLVTQRLTKLINVPSLLNHYSAGVAGCLYSLGLGSVDNTRRFESSAERLSEALPELYAHPLIADRAVLHVVDALIAQYHGETSTMLHYAKPLNELRFSRDPVALDVLSIRELDHLRKGSTTSFPTNALPFIDMLYRENAPLLELGVADPDRIRVEHR
ncbi:MAG: DUF362 domain-containing protein [Verrucomicrobia bacterium]|nr:DUF362 domain-containing protein [Verrucomicrobiota bacterium]